MTAEMTEEEAKKLSVAIKRAREFELQEEKNLLRQPIQGQLSKYTNVVKGWQYRWFVLTPERVMLEYFEREEYKNQRPRGTISLVGAAILPSDEDSQTFVINSSNGEIYKLKANNASERLDWVNRLRATAESCIRQEAMGANEHASDSGITSLNLRHRKNIPFDVRSSPSKSSSKYIDPSNTSQAAPSTRPSKQPDFSEHSDDMLSYARDLVSQARLEHKAVTQAIEVLPPDGAVSRFDKDLLMLKATSGATVLCLEECLKCLQRQHLEGSLGAANPNLSYAHQSSQRRVGDGSSYPVVTGVSTSAPNLVSLKNLNAKEMSVLSSVVNYPLSSAPSTEPIKVNRDEEVEDSAEYLDEDLGTVEHHKSVILSLLQQLKLGMDLTKVVLPTFILEKRSLLEMFADCMCHPDIFLSITDQSTAEKRMLTFVEWYLTSLHGGRQGSLAKKPYNPIIGETFYCSWRIGNQQFNGSSESTCSSVLSSNGDAASFPQQRLFYCAEQVSHHPPVTAFYFECPEKQMCMNASIWTRSKFMGMSLSVVMEGKVQLHLQEHGEIYEFSLPSAYARSILTVPWVELGGDRINISCAKTGYSANVTFHTKPFYGGKLHKVTGDVKAPGGEIICRVSGEWNGSLSFADSSGTITKVIDVSKLKRHRKCVRPVSVQNENESRKLWQRVTEALKSGDVETATSHKRMLEERQRKDEKQRKELNIPFPTKLFHKPTGSSSWHFKRPLQEGQKEPGI